MRKEEIEGAIQDVKELLKIFQSDTDLRVQRAVVKAKAQVQEKRTDATKNKCSDLKSMHTSKQKTENKKGGAALKKRIHGFMKPGEATYRKRRSRKQGAKRSAQYHSDLCRRRQLYCFNPEQKEE